MPGSPTKLIVEIDSREKTPLLFPKTIRRWKSGKPDGLTEIIPAVLALPAGDYRLKIAPELAVVERKASITELFNNLCTDDAERQGRAFAALRDAAAYPYLLLESGPSELLTPTERCTSPDFVLQRLVRVCTKFNLRLIFGGRAHTPAARRTLGTLVLYVLLGHLPPDLW